MKNIKFEEQLLRENAKTLHVLLVVGHAGTRLKLSKILKSYFGNVNVCSYSDEALTEFNKSKFDLIIAEQHLSDTKGCEICANIKMVASKKPIVIVSNKSDVNELIELINIGIDGFIEVPLDKDNIIHILSRVTNDISDMKMLYKSFDLSDLLNIEEKKVIQTDSKDENDYPVENVNSLFKNLSSMSAIELIDAYPTDLEIIGDKLLEIIDDMDICINKFLNHTTRENALEVSFVFEKFSRVLSHLAIFSNIEISTRKISNVFENVDCTKSYQDYSDILFLLTGGLLKWCNEIFIDKTSPNIYYMDKSILADSLTISNMFLETYEDSAEAEIEFF